MKNSKIIFFLLISLLLGMSSCRNDEDRIIEITEPNGSGLMFEGAVSGQVTDLNGNPIENAMVSLEGISITTDKNGLYAFGDIQLMEDQRVVLKVSDPNHFEISRAFTTSKNRSILNFELLNKLEDPTTFNSTNEAALSVSKDGLTTFINIPPNAYVLDGTDTPYNGNINVFMSFINPASRSNVNSIPGDLGGIAANGEIVQLGSYSMLALELESVNGQKLNLAAGIEATIRFAIPDEYASSAPSNIPLWVFDLETASWKEEGAASLSTDGTMYEGTVTHFSFWNCDAPFPVIEISGRVVDENGSPQTGVIVRITILNSALTGYAVTDSNGEYDGKIPSGENLKVEYYRNYPCDDYIDGVEIGPFDNDVVLDDHIFSYPEIGYNLLSGRILDCDGLPSPTSYLLLFGSDDASVNLAPDNEGNFSIEIPDCWTNLVLNAYDYNGGFTTTPLFFQSGFEEDVTVPDFILCDEDLSFFELIHEGTTMRTESFLGAFKGDNLFLSTNGADSLLVGKPKAIISILDFGTSVIEIGNYDVSRFSIEFWDENNEFHTLGCTELNMCEVEINIESVGDIGGYIKGSYSGSVADGHPDFPGLWDISVTFSALRQN